MKASTLPPPALAELPRNSREVKGVTRPIENAQAMIKAIGALSMTTGLEDADKDIRDASHGLVPETGPPLTQASLDAAQACTTTK